MKWSSITFAASLLSACGFLAVLTGCTVEDGTKELNFAVYGEEFIEEEIPADETDGWSIRFDKFLICIGDIRATHNGSVVAQDAEYRVFDLAQTSGGAGFLAATVHGETSRGLHDISYRLAGENGATAGNASTADVAFINSNGYAVYVELTATDGDTIKTLAAGFAGATTYSGCFTTVDFDSAGSARIELTIHGDHLFYSDLGDTPSVRFAALAAADTDDDNAITPAELAAAPAGAGAGADNLLALLEALVATLGHIDGEGHCADAVPQ